jgi:hypothetical protein
MQSVQGWKLMEQTNRTIPAWGTWHKNCADRHAGDFLCGNCAA